jgi:threonine/homoserine efflux transporter RhtA
LLAVKNPRRVINIALVVVAVLAIGAAVIAARSGGRTSNTGNARACGAFWNWYDGTGGAAPAVSAYRQATTQPLIADLYNVSVGLTDKAKGLNGNKAANAAFAQSAAGKVMDDCATAGYPDPAS